MTIGSDTSFTTYSIFYFVGTSTTVIVTHIKNPCHFMVQKCSDMPTINNLSRIINAYGNNPTAPIPKRLERGKSSCLV